MNFTEKISLEEINGRKNKIRLIEPESNNEAVLTHYIHNSTNGVSKFYKKEAIEITKNILQKRYPKNIISNMVAQDALQYGIFDMHDIPFLPHDKPKFKFIDLFAGIGGFRLALQNLGGKCIFTSEWDKDAQRTYRANFGEVPFGDITKKEIKAYIPDKFDVLCAGFPCQAFSIAGHRKGFEDTRGTLFFDIEQIIANHQPKVVFLENVKNLLTHDKGRTFKTICNILNDKLGYKVYYKVLNTMTHANIPQNRERIFIVAFDPNQVPNYDSFQFPSEVKLTNRINNIISTSEQDDEFYYSKEHQYYSILDEQMTNENTLYQWRRVYVRENKNNVCPTLTANMGTGGHNVPLLRDLYGIRKLTPRECFSFQGFPKTYKLPNVAKSHLYKQAGNAVTTTLIERVGKNIIQLL